MISIYTISVIQFQVANDFTYRWGVSKSGKSDIILSDPFFCHTESYFAANIFSCQWFLLPGFKILPDFNVLIFILQHVSILHRVLNISINKQILQGVEMAHKFKVYSALANGLSRDPNTHTGKLPTTFNFSTMDSDDLSWSPWTPVPQAQTNTQICSYI